MDHPFNLTFSNNTQTVLVDGEEGDTRTTNSTLYTLNGYGMNFPVVLTTVKNCLRSKPREKQPNKLLAIDLNVSICSYAHMFRGNELPVDMFDLVFQYLFKDYCELDNVMNFDIKCVNQRSVNLIRKRSNRGMFDFELVHDDPDNYHIRNYVQHISLRQIVIDRVTCKPKLMLRFYMMHRFVLSHAGINSESDAYVESDHKVSDHTMNRDDFLTMSHLENSDNPAL